MPGFDSTGPMGMGPMTGGGRGFCRPWGIGATVRRYDYPRWVPYAYPHYGAYGFGPLAPRMTREQELEFLKSEAQAMRNELKELETRIGQLSTEKE
jgi:hypothetical protein